MRPISPHISPYLPYQRCGRVAGDIVRRYSRWRQRTRHGPTVERATHSMARASSEQCPHLIWMGGSSAPMPPFDLDGRHGTVEPGGVWWHVVLMRQ